MHVDEVAEAQRAGEAVETVEGLGCEGGEVVDVLGLSGAEERLEHGIGQHAVVHTL